VIYANCGAIAVIAITTYVTIMELSLDEYPPPPPPPPPPPIPTPL